MDIFHNSITYFKQLAQIPRPSLKEERVREWIIRWANKQGWVYQTDAVGNLLVRAHSKNPETLCLQAHMDMVCVANNCHDFSRNGITVIEKDEKIYAKGTSLGADNGIGIAIMMALADINNRPSLELLFTVGEEIGLVGAQKIGLPISAKRSINLDWSDSKSIGIGCGGTLLMKGTKNLENIPSTHFSQNDNTFLIQLHGMKGGHSGEDIRHYRGNALIEVLKLLQEIPSITHIGEIHGGEADNVIPHSAHMIVRYEKHPNLLNNELSHIQKMLRKKYKHDTISLSAERKYIQSPVYDIKNITPILSEIIEVGTGVQNWGPANTPLSSWNLGILSMRENTLSLHYFLRTNLENAGENMKNSIMTGLSNTEWSMDHESPPWNTIHTASPLIKTVQEFFQDEEGIPIPCITTHAAVECGILAKKYPQTEWVSVGASISDMHTTRESIKIHDFREFTERMEALITHL